jgi:hypothetical protein
MPWNLCIVVVDCLVQYCKFYFTTNSWKNQLAEPEKIADTIRFVLNELLENAVKFNHSGSIILTIRLEDDHLTCFVNNQIRSNLVPGLRERFHLLRTQRPDTLYSEQLNLNLQDKEKNQSGLGHLILLSDYKVALDWRFYFVSACLTRIQTIATIKLT